jgi:uncharacterized protein YihD (DUF1040 family)
MKPVIAFAFLLSCLLGGCRNESPKTPNQAPNPTISDTTAVKYDENVHLLVNNPTDIWQTDYLAFQVSHRENNKGRSYFSSDEAVYKEATSVGATCWNLVFYNTKSEEYYLLDSTRKMLIYEYDLNDTAKGKVIRNIARYDVQFDDNKDSKFTNADAKRLFVSDRLGRFFHQISPEGVSVLRYKFAPKENFILLYGKRDANQDGVFDEKDPESVYRLDMNQTAEKTSIAHRVFSKEFEEKLQKRVETDWKLHEH